MKALIIDDEIDTCYLLSGILQQKDFSSDWVTTLSDAETALSKEQPTVVFLDNYLPDGNGIDFVDHIRKVGRGIKIVLITAYDTTPAEQLKVMRRGVDLFIPKPFSMETITQCIDQLVRSA